MVHEISELRKSLLAPNKERLDRISSIVRPALARTTNILLEFTEHDLNHSLGVEKIYDILLRENLGRLNEDEKFLLIAATLLHDLGMVGSTQWKNREELLRDAHHSLSKQIINEHRVYLGFTHVEADVIGSIAEAHRKVDFNILEKNLAYGIGKSIRPRLLAALLRLADELHVTDDRAPEFVTKLISPNPLSRAHHERHQVILGVDWSREDPKVIHISAIVNDWDMEDAVNTMVCEIQAKLTSVSDILLENGIQIAAIEPQYRLGGVIRKEVLLYLAQNPQCSNEQIIERLNQRLDINVHKEIQELDLSGFILNVNGILSLNSDKTVFTNVYNYLHGTRYELEYIRSDYVRKHIGDIFDDIALNLYGTRYDDGEKEDRILLVSNSPTVLDTLLNRQNTKSDFGVLDRKGVLDAILLGGYMQDVSEIPQIASYNPDSTFAVQAVANNIKETLGGFVQIMKNIDEAMEVKKNE